MEASEASRMKRADGINQPPITLPVWNYVSYQIGVVWWQRGQKTMGN